MEKRKNMEATKMYCIEIIKQPFGPKVVSGFITSDAIGLGIKDKKLYKCFSDEHVYNWIKSWEMGSNDPASWGFHNISEFD